MNWPFHFMTFSLNISNKWTLTHYFHQRFKDHVYLQYFNTSPTVYIIGLNVLCCFFLCRIQQVKSVTGPSPLLTIEEQWASFSCMTSPMRSRLMQYKIGESKSQKKKKWLFYLSWTFFQFPNLTYIKYNIFGYTFKKFLVSVLVSSF